MDIPSDGPYYEDFVVGHAFDRPRGVTVDGGVAAVYQAIAGDGSALSLDRELAEAVTGHSTRLISPTLLMQISIGASTVATKRVVANLFYRDVKIRQQVFEGETLRTTTTVLALADASQKLGRPRRGKVLLGIETSASGKPVVRYERCALVRLRSDDLPGHADNIGGPPSALDLADCEDLVPLEWDVSALGATAVWETGESRDDPLRDVVDGATALVRLTNNQAAVHRDVGASPYDTRLVYGGHTVALAHASLTRMLHGMATVVAWHGCDHVGPVFEGDLIEFSHTMLDQRPVGVGCLRAVQIRARAKRDDGRVEVLNWTPIVYTS